METILKSQLFNQAQELQQLSMESRDFVGLFSKVQQLLEQLTQQHALMQLHLKLVFTWMEKRPFVLQAEWRADFLELFGIKKS